MQARSVAIEVIGALRLESEAKFLPLLDGVLPEEPRGDLVVVDARDDVGVAAEFLDMAHPRGESAMRFEAPVITMAASRGDCSDGFLERIARGSEGQRLAGSGVEAPGDGVQLVLSERP